MRNDRLGWIVFGAWLGVWPLAAHADYLSDARAALKKGDVKTAQIDLRNAVRADPQNAEAHYWLGKLSLDLGDAVAAEREATAARDRGYDPHIAVPLYAQALLAQQKFKDLLAQLKPDGKDAVLDAQILVARGYAQIALKQEEAAHASFVQAEQVAPGAVEPLLADARLAAARGDLARATDKVDRALQAQPKSVEARQAKSQILAAQGDTKGALALLDQVLTDQPNAVQAKLERAGLLLGTNQVDKAGPDIDAVLAVAPGNVQAQYFRAVQLVSQGDFKAADATLERIAPAVGRIPRGNLLLAIVKERLGQPEQAEDAAQHYLARVPNDITARKLMARIDFGKKRPDLALETLQSVEESGQGDAETFDLLGRAYAATGRGDEAVKAFQKAQSLAPDNVGLETRLAATRMSMGQPEAAVGDLERVLAKSPQQPQVGEALFFAALATGDLGQAADALARVRGALGDTPAVRNLAALLQQYNLDFDGARAGFAAIVQSNPDFLPAQINLARVLALAGKGTEAEAVLLHILDAQPASEPALTMMVTHDLQSGQPDKAIALVERARTASSTPGRLTVALGRTLLRAGHADKALELVAQDKTGGAGNAELLALKADALLALGKPGEAREAYQQLLQVSPQAVGARRQLVALLVQAADYESARTVVQAGLAQSPRNYQLMQELVGIDLKAGGEAAALSTAERLQQQNRDFDQVRALKGDILLTVGHGDDAIKAYTEAAATAPSPVLVGRLASAQLRGGHPEAAAKTLADWIAAHPDDVGMTLQLADADIAAKRYDDAVAHLRSVLKLRPRDAVALNNLAWVQQERKDPAAEGLAREAFLLQPGPQTADTLGWILVGEGKAATGVMVLRQASADPQAQPQILYHYAVALKDTGQTDDAIKLLTALVADKVTFAEKPAAQSLLDQLKGKSS